MAALGRHVGTVVEFDSQVGLGVDRRRGRRPLPVPLHRDRRRHPRDRRRHRGRPSLRWPSSVATRPPTSRLAMTPRDGRRPGATHPRRDPGAATRRGHDVRRRRRDRRLPEAVTTRRPHPRHDRRRGARGGASSTHRASCGRATWRSRPRCCAPRTSSWSTDGSATPRRSLQPADRTARARRPPPHSTLPPAAPLICTNARRMLFERVTHRGRLLTEPVAEPVDETGDGVDRQRRLDEIRRRRPTGGSRRARTAPSRGW